MTSGKPKEAPGRPALRLVGEPPPRGDDQLCRDFLSGELQAFGELVTRHQQLVFRLLRRYCQRSEDALDLAQRCFLQAFEAARGTLPRLGKEGPMPFRQWLVRIAVNLGKNHARAERRWPTAPESEAVRLAEPSSAPEALERAQRQALVRRAVLALPPRQREVFTLRIDGGLSFAELAEVLGIQQANARVHFHHAVRRLAEVVRATRENAP